MLRKSGKSKTRYVTAARSGLPSQRGSTPRSHLRQYGQDDERIYRTVTGFSGFGPLSAGICGLPVEVVVVWHAVTNGAKLATAPNKNPRRPNLTQGVPS